MAAQKIFTIRLVKSKGAQNSTFWKSIGYDLVELSRAVGTTAIRFQIEGKVTGEEESIELKVLKMRGDIVKELRIKEGKYKSASVGLWYKSGENEKTKETYSFNSSPNVDSRELEDKISRNIEFRMFMNTNRKSEKAPDLSMYISAKSEKGEFKAQSANASPSGSDNDTLI